MADEQIVVKIYHPLTVSPLCNALGISILIRRLILQSLVKLPPGSEKLFSEMVSVADPGFPVGGGVDLVGGGVDS